MFKKLKRKAVFLLIFSFLIFSPLFTSKAEKQSEFDILFFSSPSCPHCLNEKKFLESILENNPELKIKEYYLADNSDLIKELYEKYNVPSREQGLVPISFFPQKKEYLLGFTKENEEKIKKYIENIEIKDLELKEENKLRIPFTKKKIETKNLSLPLLAIIMGLVDGFNVCSLGALIIVLGLVMVLKSRKKTLFLGGAFLFITALVYGLLIFIWHQFFSLLSPYLRNMKLLIALFSLLGGLYLLYNYLKTLKQGASCQPNNLIDKLSLKIKERFEKKSNFFALLSVIILFSALITVIEFPCSAFLPVLFAGILAEAELPLLHNLFYLAIFIFFYLLDEIIIFLIAFFTMKIKIFSPKALNFFNLLASLIFLFLGAFYLYQVFFL